MLERREQFHTLRLNEHLDRLNPALSSAAAHAREFFTQLTGDPHAAAGMALASIEHARDRQSLSLAYFDVFWLCAALAASLVLLVFLMRRSVAAKGAHVAAE